MEHTYQWNIQNVNSSLRDSPHHVLESRMFYFSTDYQTLWQMRVLPCTDETALQIELVRVFGTSRYHLILNANDKIIRMYFNSVDKSQKFETTCLDTTKHLCLRFQFQMDPMTQNPFNWHHIKDMSHYYRQLMSRPDTYADLMLHCDSKIFPVHKFILAQRAPAFFRSLDMTSEKDVRVGDMSADTLHILLEYVYTGELSTHTESSIPCFKVYQELVQMIERYRFGNVFLNEFTREVAFIFDQRLTLDGGSNYESRWVELFFPRTFHFIRVAHHLLILTTRFTLQTIAVTIDHVNVLQSTKVYYYLYTYNVHSKRLVPLETVRRPSVDDDNDNDDDDKHTLQFTEKCSRKHRVFQRLAGKNVFLCLSMLPLSNVQQQQQQRQPIADKMQNNYEFCKLQWYHEMGSLIIDDSSSGGGGDVTLIFGKDKQPLKMWKALLAVQSPVFACMFRNSFFKESQTQCVELRDFDLTTGLRWREYLKTGGHINPTHFLLDAELYVFANKYLIQGLFETCSEMLFDHVRKYQGASCDMYYDAFILSDACGDAELKRYSKRFICRMHNNFQKLHDQFPHLAGEITAQYPPRQ